MKITKEQENIIQDFCDDNSKEMLSYRDDYSGRFMMGDCCIGIETTDRYSSIDGALMRLMLHLVDNDQRELAEAMTNGVRLDNMGLGAIAYFPNIQAKHGECDSDEE